MTSRRGSDGGSASRRPAGARIKVRRSGAVAHGPGAIAAGRDGIAVGRDLHVHSSTTGPDEAALRKAYLGRVFQQAEVLSLSGVDPAAAAGQRDAKLRLAAVYTALVTRTPVEKRQNEPLGSKSELLSALAQLDRHARLVLLGDPGSGKSTLVSFLTLCLAGEALGRSDANLKILRSPFPSAEDGKKRQPWRHKALLPIRLVLRELAAQHPPMGKQATAKHLWDFLAADLIAAGIGEFFPFLKKELLELGGLVMFDGLDEVPEKWRQQIRAMIEDFAGGFSRCRLLVTSRSYAYRSLERALPDFKEAELAPFSKIQIESFVRRWYSHLATLGRLAADSAEGQARLLLKVIFPSEKLLDLAERPLLLTLMVSLHAWRGGGLPAHREELYAESVKLLLYRWESHRVVVDAHGQPIDEQPSLTEFLKVGEETVRALLEELAYEAHGAQTDSKGTADISQSRLVDRLMELSGNPEVRPALLVEYLRDRAGLLEPRDVGVYTFPHRTFQEYLAACYLTGDSFPDRLAELARVDPLRWREVVLLAGAKAYRGVKSSIWTLAEALCWRPPDDPELETADVWGAHLAGQMIVESADLAQVSGPNRSKLERLRSWLVHLLGESRLPAPERALAGRTLAALGDPRPEVMTVDGMEFRTLAAGRFWMGSGDKEPEAYDDEKPRHEVDLPYEYQMARFPVTVAQYREYVEAAGAEVGDASSLSGPANGPVVMVSWFEAMAFCRWLTERWRRNGKLEKGWSVCLPSEAEWEKAARGPGGLLYPWGDEFDSEKANTMESGCGAVTSMGCFPTGSNASGCEEMSGNVWEWTKSVLRGYPYAPADGREDLQVPAESLRVLRGGSLFLKFQLARCTCRYWVIPGGRYGDVGFRVVLSPFFSGL